MIPIEPNQEKDPLYKKAVDASLVARIDFNFVELDVLANFLRALESVLARGAPVHVA